MGIMNTSGLFKAKSHDAGWVAVGIDAHGVHLAQVSLVGAMPRVARCEYHEGEVSAAALEKVCRGINGGKHDFTTLLAPGEYQMLMVDAPNVPANELKTAIRWKIKDGLSYHIDDATVDVLQIPASKYGSDRAQSMYAIAASNETIRKRIALFEQAKIKLDVIDIPEMAQRNIAALFEQEGRALVLLSFDDNGGLLTFTAGGEMFLSRRLEISAGQLQDANENLRQQYRGRVELELQRSLDYFDRQYNHLPVSRVLVSAPEDNGLVSSLASAVDVKVERLDLSQVMDISMVPALADSEFVAHALPVLGAALRQESRVL
ncbi:MAG: agglutinin biogenesis protein MshI [Betaproteobacteria bacterium RBG_16_56_24]|nr:MAG: agglutinin biogenesis protein MshI [Betaproteobacteria bacterium RBG_16_56_24]